MQIIKGGDYMAYDLNGQTILITGAASGIGRAVALRAAEAGANLVLAGHDANGLATLESEMHSFGARFITVEMDVRRRADVQALVARAVDLFGGIDVLLNAAGIGIMRPALELTEDEFDQMLDTNLKGTFLMAQAAAAAMATRKKGLIINLPGVLGKAPMMGAAGYAASKYGVVGLTKTMALDLKRAGVRFCLLHFGGVDSPFWDTIDMRVQRDKMLTLDDAATAVMYAITQPDGLVLSELVLQPESHQLI